MSYPGSKIFTFVVGIFLGMLAALGLVFLIMNQFNPLAAFSPESSSGSRDTIVDMRSFPLKRASAKAKKVEVLPQKEVVPSDSEIENELESSSNFNSEIEAPESEIIVKRDEFISSRELTLIKIKPDLQKQKRDSVIRQLQGSPNHPVVYRIEYWKSPLNYKGFRMIKSTIVAFGLSPEESAQLYSLNDVIYLKHGISVFRLGETDEFLPFKREIDEDLLKQLKQ
jgi:hypothetical protein